VLIALDDNVALDKEYIAIDRHAALPFPNGTRDNIYISFTRFGPGRDDIQFSRSTNLGALYSRPVTISETLNQARAGDYRQVSVPAAGVNSDVYVAWSEALNINAPGEDSDSAFDRRRPILSAESATPGRAGGPDRV
jgi:hypothetical protein